MLTRLMAVSAACVLAAAPLHAQQRGLVPVSPNARQGFWIGFGFGPGSAGADCTSCTTDRTTGFSGYLRMGGTVSPHVLLGGESNGWVRPESGVTETLAYASFIASIYPSAAGAFFLKFGIGGMTYEVSDGTGSLTATAPAGSIGLGYDVRVGKMLSVTPFVNVLASSAVSFKINGISVPTGQDIRLNLVQLGAGLTWH